MTNNNRIIKPHPTTRIDILICLFLAMVTIGCYYHATDYGFASFDDHLNVSGNPHVQSGLSWENIKWAFRFTQSGDKHYWHPLTSISHMVDCQLYGLDPWGHHLTNLLLHAANVLLVYLLLLKTTTERWKSLFVASVFAFHPINVESVVWIAERKNILSTIFFLMAVLFYFRFLTRPKLVRMAPVLLSMFLGLLCKPIIVVLPFALLLLDIWPFNRISIQSLKKPSDWNLLMKNLAPVFLEKIPLFALSGFGVYLSSLSMHRLGAVITTDIVPMNLRIANTIISYPTYLGKLFWPFNLAVFYPFPVKMPSTFLIGASAFLILFISILFLLLRNRYPWGLVGWFWFIGILFPAMGIMQNGLWPAMADRWSYLPMIGICLIVAWSVPEIIHHHHFGRQLNLIFTAVVLLFLLILLNQQIQYWSSNISLFRHAANTTKNNAVAYNNLGNALVKSDDPTAGIAQYRKAIEINPAFKQANYNLGQVLSTLGKTGEAKTYLEKAIQADPFFEEAYHNLGAVYMMEDNQEKAAIYFQKAIEVNSLLESAYYNLGIIRANQGKLDESIQLFSKALHIRPDFPEAHSKRQQIQRFQKNTEKKIQSLQKSPRQNHIIFYQIGLRYMQIGRTEPAEKAFNQALEQKHDHLPSLEKLIEIYTGKKQYEKAIRRLQESLDRVGDNKNIYYNIACLLSIQHRIDESILWLKKAVENGYDNWKLIRTDADLANLRAAEQFKVFIKKHTISTPQTGGNDS